MNGPWNVPCRSSASSVSRSMRVTPSSVRREVRGPNVAFHVASQRRLDARPEQIRQVTSGIADHHRLPVDGRDGVESLGVRGSEHEVVESVVAVDDREACRLPLEPALDARRERLEHHHRRRSEVGGVALHEHRRDELHDRGRLLAERRAHPVKVTERRVAPAGCVQAGQVLRGGDELPGVASRELVALPARAQVLEDERERRVVVADRAEVAAGRPDGERLGELTVEAHLVAVAPGGTGRAALGVRRRELAHDGDRCGVRCAHSRTNRVLCAICPVPTDSGVNPMTVASCPVWRSTAVSQSTVTSRGSIRISGSATPGVCQGSRDSKSSTAARAPPAALLSVATAAAARR